MQQQTHSIQFLRQRKFLAILPILIFPFLTFLLWSIGMIGVRESETLAQDISQQGLNLNLPGALPRRDSSRNKLEYYEQADKDSAKYRSLAKNDPYYPLSQPKQKEDSLNDFLLHHDNRNESKLSYDPYGSGLQTGKDPNEEKVLRKLAQLKAELNQTKSASELNDQISNANSEHITAGVKTEDIDRLESMMQTMQGNGNTGDPELQQISGMLEKILDIQHPDRIKEKLKQKSTVNMQQVFPVTRNDDKLFVSLLESKQRDSVNQIPIETIRNSFYSFDDRSFNNGEQQNTITAMIPETQTLVTGATVKLRLTNEVYINGVLIPADEFIYGTASLTGERLAITISTIRYQNNILPVSLAVYDLDGMSGIYVPGAIGRDVSKQSTEQAIQSMGIASLDPSIGAQAASAGIQAAKSLIGKKVKQIKVTVKAGYQVLLRDENQKSN